jgi:hypothetical protein
MRGELAGLEKRAARSWVGTSENRAQPEEEDEEEEQQEKEEDEEA